MENRENTYNDLPETEKRKLQKQFHESELNYFSSFAFESGAIEMDDLRELNARIDKKMKGGPFGLNMNVFIALICGIFIGVSVFFVWYEKSKTHPSHYEDLNEKPLAGSAPAPAVAGTKPAVAGENKTEAREHFSTGSEEQLYTYTPMEDAEIKDIPSIEVKAPDLSTEENFEFIPNASVIFIHDLKIANYKGYYFKDEHNIDIRTRGLSAQFSNTEESQGNLNKRLEERDYYAHEIIKDAMGAYHRKQFALCIELLELLYTFNKNDVNTQFYSGMSWFHLGNYNKAAGFLEAAENNSVNIFMQEAEFYKALCYKKSGKTDSANELFKKIASRKLFYSVRAKEELIKQ